MYDRDRLECIVGDNIRMYRKMRKLTQDALADIIEIDRAAISRYESGTNGMMGIDILLRFCRALGVTPNNLMMDSEHTDTSRTYDLLNEENRIAVDGVIDQLYRLQERKNGHVA